MILLLLLIIPLIGSLIISMIPVSELSEEEAKVLANTNLESELAINTLTTEEITAQLKQETDKILKQENYKRSRLVQIIGMSTTLITFIISLYMWVLFDSNVNQYQFVYNFDSISFCHFYIGIDGISLYFVLLTTFLTPVALLANFGSISNNVKYFIISFLVLETLQIALFVVLDLLLFYIFFESILPVLFLVILIYGTGEDRVRSSFLFFLYTLAGSLFMLLAILQIYNYVGSTDFQLLSLSEISLESQIILWSAFFLALAVKTPLIPVHMWLPRAHTSAPLGGSILLAGTVLKFATYGMLRLLIHLFPDASNYCSVIVQVIAIISLIFASLATILQQDTKTLIAYSSICHIAVVVLGIFSNSFIGIIGAILLGIAHGFVSPALFYCVGGIMYDRYHKRNIGYYKGLSLTMPVFITLFFIFILANTGIPLTLNFLGEQLSLIGMWERNPIITVLGSTGIVLSACYSIWMYNRISYGSFSPYISPMPDISRKEFNLLIALLLPTVIFGIFPSVIIETLDIPTTTLLYVTETPTSLNYLVYTQQDLLTLPQYFPTSTPIPLGNGPMEGDEVELINSKLELINILNNIDKQDLFEIYKFIISKITDVNFNLQEFLNSLTILELFAFISLCFNFVILSALLSIIFILYGDFLIKHFNLETKYPKLANFINFRKKITKYTMFYNIFLILFCSLAQLSACLMTFWHYFS